MECYKCNYMELIKNSEGEYIHLCVNTESGAYLEETGICGNCDLEPEEGVSE